MEVIMSKIVNKKITDYIGNTPLVYLESISKGLNADIYVKLESFNPCSSVKDRIALSMIEDAEKRGDIKPGMTLVEPTSGNTGIGLSFVAAARGYRLIIAMPSNMSVERRKIMKALGAELVLTPAKDGMKGAIKAAEDICCKEKAYMLRQFDNPANPLAHELNTGIEILSQTKGNIDIFVAGVGTGGTITGTAKALKKQSSQIRIVAVEPQGSPVLSGGSSGKHKIQGIGAGFIPGVLDMDLIDEIIKVSDEKAAEYARKIALKEGILVGISSGAALSAAVSLAKKNINKGKKIVVLLPDSGERYLSTWLYQDLE